MSTERVIKMGKIEHALQRALRVEVANLQDLIGMGWEKDSAPVCASKLNISVYEEALELARTL